MFTAKQIYIWTMYGSKSQFSQVQRSTVQYSPLGLWQALEEPFPILVGHGANGWNSFEFESVKVEKVSNFLACFFCLFTVAPVGVGLHFYTNIFKDWSQNKIVRPVEASSRIGIQAIPRLKKKANFRIIRQKCTVEHFTER